MCRKPRPCQGGWHRAETPVNPGLTRAWAISLTRNVVGHGYGSLKAAPPRPVHPACLAPARPRKKLLAALLFTAGTLVAGPQNKCPDPAVTDVRASQIKSARGLTRYQFVVEVTNVGSETFKTAAGSVMTL